MRKAKYDMRQVICPSASCIGHSSNIARPGYWVTWVEGNREFVARVLGRIAATDRDGGTECAGFLAVMRLYPDMTHAGIAWVDPKKVRSCYDRPPAALLAWITGDDWVSSKKDIARIVAMNQYGTTSESFIASRNDADKPYNARPEYAAQWILE